MRAQCIVKVGAVQYPIVEINGEGNILTKDNTCNHCISNRFITTKYVLVCVTHINLTVVLIGKYFNSSWSFRSSFHFEYIYIKNIYNILCNFEFKKY